MSRAGYSDDIDSWQLIRWRGQVASAIRGKRGQAFLRELAEALDAMPEKKLIAHELQEGESVCAIGSVGVRRGVDLSKLDPEDPDTIANTFGIAQQLVREIEYMNDEAGWDQTPGRRWARMREWVAEQIKVSAMKLALVTPQSDPPIDVNALIRADIKKRDWSAVHIQADRRRPVDIEPSRKRTWL